MPKLVTLIGFPGVGKSTYAQQLVAQGFTLISGDAVIESTREKYGLASTDEAYVQHKDEINARMDTLMNEAVTRGDSIVVDALNLSQRHRRRHLEAIRNAPHAYTAEAVVLYPPEAEEHAARLGARALLQGHLNMADGLQMMRWEQSYEPPQAAEGFASIRYEGIAPKDPLMSMQR